MVLSGVRWDMDGWMGRGNLRIIMQPEGCLANFLLYRQGSYFVWKTWKNERAFSSQGKVMEFLNFLNLAKKSRKSQGILKHSGKVREIYKIQQI